MYLLIRLPSCLWLHMLQLSQNIDLRLILWDPVWAHTDSFVYGIDLYRLLIGSMEVLSLYLFKLANFNAAAKLCGK